MFDEQPTSWPHLVGMDGNEAVELIKNETGFTQVYTMDQNSMMTMDYCLERVRVFVDGHGRVARPPTVG